MINTAIDTKFIRDRITQLRLQKGVSEYKMSYDLGHSRSYIYNISSGKSLPPMGEFLQICDYFGITPTRSCQKFSKQICLWDLAQNIGIISIIQIVEAI